MTYLNFFEKHNGSIYVVFRVFVGLLFAQHGMQKLFGWFGGVAGNGQPVVLLSLMGLAGVIELFGGLAVALGLFTRPAALLSVVEMIVAYFMGHASQGLIPLSNKGELALLYFAAFLLVLAMGAGKWSTEQSLLGREMF